MTISRGLMVIKVVAFHHGRASTGRLEFAQVARETKPVTGAARG